MTHVACNASITRELTSSGRQIPHKLRLQTYINVYIEATL